MKNIFKILGVFFVALIAFSCEPDEYDVPDIDLVPVYNISETGNNNMFEMNIYREQNLFTVWTNKGKISSFTTTGFSDTSDELNYMVTFSRKETVIETDDEGNETSSIVSYAYELTGAKDADTVTLKTVKTNSDETTSESSVSGILIEKEVYN